MRKEIHSTLLLRAHLTYFGQKQCKNNFVYRKSQLNNSPVWQEVQKSLQAAGQQEGWCPGLEACLGSSWGKRIRCSHLRLSDLEGDSAVA